MTRDRRLRRMVVALIASALLNGILLVLDGIAGGQRYPEPILSKVVGIMFSVPGAVSEAVVPAGHDAAHILGAIAVTMVSSVIFYGVVVWVILTIWARARGQGSNQEGSALISK